jgi:hypothetical protein
MAFFNGSIEKGGMFNNGFASFEYRVSEGKAEGQGTWGLENGFAHEIAICDGSVRFANVKKTVAYVCVDQDECGKPVVEKWNIKHNWSRGIFDKDISCSILNS